MAIARQRIHLPPGGWRRAISGLITGTLWKGPEVDRLERAFADFIGAPEAVAVPSGRAGLSFIFSALGLEPGAEVICSAFGYPVVPHLAKSLGFELRLVDCELETLGMDPAALSAAITAGLARGASLSQSVDAALDFVARAIGSAPGLGAGHGPLNHLVVPTLGPQDQP